MYPEKLSNDLCSLNPNTDKLALTAEIVLDKN
jgi:exoribonuclease R